LHIIATIDDSRKGRRPGDRIVDRVKRSHSGIVRVAQCLSTSLLQKQHHGQAVTPGEEFGGKGRDLPPRSRAVRWPDHLNSLNCNCNSLLVTASALHAVLVDIERPPNRNVNDFSVPAC
jgi:hypothetical protein